MTCNCKSNPPGRHVRTCHLYVRPKKVRSSALVGLSQRELEACVYAVETMCGFAIIDTLGAIKALCALDKRIAEKCLPEFHEALAAVGVRKPNE